MVVMVVRGVQRMMVVMVVRGEKNEVGWGTNTKIDGS